MNRHESMLRIAASSDISVLLLGESGSGKEVAARFVHAHSKRAGGPFIALNCGAIAKGLTESIL
ncbi:sigma 54-interacting transcriptional regulator, partial [uncultured Fibrobacter sp.]